jgi:hypothetical protein
MGFLQTHNIQLPTKEGAIEDLFDNINRFFRSFYLNIVQFLYY